MGMVKRGSFANPKDNKVEWSEASKLAAFEYSLKKGKKGTK
jgi:hypothetical protein